MKKRLSLVNDERILLSKKILKACVGTADDWGCYYATSDRAQCTTGALDFVCKVDWEACSNYAEDYCGEANNDDISSCHDPETEDL